MNGRIHTTPPSSLFSLIDFILFYFFKLHCIKRNILFSFVIHLTWYHVDACHVFIDKKTRSWTLIILQLSFNHVAFAMIRLSNMQLARGD